MCRIDHLVTLTKTSSTMERELLSRMQLSAAPKCAVDFVAKRVSTLKRVSRSSIYRSKNSSHLPACAVPSGLWSCLFGNLKSLFESASSCKFGCFCAYGNQVLREQIHGKNEKKLRLFPTFWLVRAYKHRYFFIQDGLKRRARLLGLIRRVFRDWLLETWFHLNGRWQVKLGREIDEIFVTWIHIYSMRKMCGDQEKCLE